jgi:hypothetical protein
MSSDYFKELIIGNSIHQSVMSFSSTETTSFSYRIEKTENGYIRIYMVASSILNGSSLFLLDNVGHLHSETPIATGNSLLIKPGFISSPDYTLVFGNNCSITTCKHR